MFRILLILVLIFYLFYKLGLFKIFAGSVREGYDEQKVNKRPPNSNLNVDSVPKENQRKSSGKSGEYVDYEEVK
jgi:hypothetical protein